MRNARGIIGDSLVNILIWIIFLIIAGGVIWFLVRRLVS